jgi:hypothetical protein
VLAARSGRDAGGSVPPAGTRIGQGIAAAVVTNPVPRQPDPGQLGPGLAEATQGR